MGGSAFSSDGLSTPRMSPEVYYSVQSRVEDILRSHFKLVGHAVEAPAKQSHGDIDVLVAEPNDRSLTYGRPMGDFLVSVLGAKTWKKMSGNSTYHLALCWPEEFRNDKTTEPAYIQIDVNLMPTTDSFHWHMFHEAHGDLWMMLGGIIRPYGLTVFSKGLSVRIAEVEKHNKEQARVVATSDPNTVLDYMGLDKERYWKPFDNWDQMLEYVSTCRFHNPARWKSRDQEEDNVCINQEDLQERGQNSGTKLLKHNDRQRVAKRPLFGYWIETYLPAHADDDPGRSAFLTREEVVKDAKEFFGPEFARNFEVRKEKMVRLIGVDKLWADVRKTLPVEGTEIGYVMKGLNREVAGNNLDEASIEAVTGLRAARRAFEEMRFDDVFDWVKINWENIGERQKRLDQEVSRVHFLAKRKKEQAKELEAVKGNQSLENAEVEA